MVHIQYPDGQAEVTKFTNGGRGREELFISAVYTDERYLQRVHVVNTEDFTAAVDLKRDAAPKHCLLCLAGQLHSQARHQEEAAGRGSVALKLV